MKRTRIMALLLAVIMVAGLMAGCSNGKNPAETTGTTPAATSGSGATSASAEQTTATEATTEATTEYEPTIDMQGYECILTSGNVARFTPAELGGESALAKQWQDAYDEIEAKFNCKLTLFGHGTSMEDMLPFAMGGEKLGDFVFMRQWDMFPFAIKGYLRALNSPEMLAAGFDPTDGTRWYQDTTKLSALNGNIYGVDTNSQYYITKLGFFMVVNKGLFADYAGVSDVYDMVRKGEWTWDKYIECARAMTVDADNDGNPEIWGVGVPMGGWETHLNGTTPVIQKDGKYVSNFSDARVLEALEFVRKQYQDEKIFPLDMDGTACRTAFANGTVGMTSVYASNMRPGDQIVDSVHDYGIIPSPKGPQASGYTCYMGSVDLWTMFASNPDYEKAVVIMNAWGARMTDDTWTTALREQWCRDDESLEMMTDYILPNSILITTAANREIDQYVRKQMTPAIISGGISPASAVEQMDQQINSLLNDMYSSVQ